GSQAEIAGDGGGGDAERRPLHIGDDRDEAEEREDQVAHRGPSFRRLEAVTLVPRLRLGTHCLAASACQACLGPAASQGLASSALGAGPPADAVDYARDIKPILAARCYACHAAIKQKGSLRLDTAALVREGGETGPAVLPGKAADSLLLKRILGQGGLARMPP